MTKSKGDYPVGRCRPPKASQFKKGESGNRSGRPKGAKGFKTAFEEALSRTVAVTERGRDIELTMLELIVRRLTNDAAQGKVGAIKMVVDLLRERAEVDAKVVERRSITPEMSAEEALEIYLEHIRETP
jgi:hypothetical protein